MNAQTLNDNIYLLNNNAKTLNNATLDMPYISWNTGSSILQCIFLFFLLNNFLEIYSCRVKQIFKSRLYEVCENLCVEPIDIIKYIRIQSRARWIH